MSQNRCQKIPQNKNIPFSQRHQLRNTSRNTPHTPHDAEPNPKARTTPAMGGTVLHIQNYSTHPREQRTPRDPAPHHTDDDDTQDALQRTDATVKKAYSTDVESMIDDSDFHRLHQHLFCDRPLREKG